MAASKRESEEESQINWANLETELSNGALECLLDHLQQNGNTQHATALAGDNRGAAAPATNRKGSQLVPGDSCGKCGSSSSSGGGGDQNECDGGGGSDEVASASPPLPTSNLVYKAKDYWDSRFAKEESYDWLASYADIAEHLHEEIPRSARVLIVGCGNSGLSADMYDDGYRNLLSTDFSEVVIEKMRAKHEERRPGLRWERMDMLAIDAEDSTFDAVVDKAAMDALMVDKGDPWNPDPATIESAHRMCTEVSRVLVPGGVFVQLSFEQVHFRKKFLLGEHVVASETAMAESKPRPSSAQDGGAVLDKRSLQHIRDDDGRGGLYGWDMLVHDIQRESGCFGHFFYVLRKRRDGHCGAALRDEDRE